MTISRRAMLGGSMALGAMTFASRGRRTWAQGGGYSVRDLGGLADVIDNGPFPYQGAFNDINDNGEVGGALVTSEVKASPAIWPVEGRRVLQKSGKFGGEVNALNSSGLAVGRRFEDVLGVPEGQFFGNAYMPAAWQDGEPLELAIPAGMGADPAGLYGRAADVNADGLIVGHYYDSGFNQGQPVIWRDGAIEMLLATPESGFGTPISINAAGMVAGTVDHFIQFSDGTAASMFLPALWTDGELEVLDLPADVALPESADDPRPSVAIRGLSDDGLLLTMVTMQSSTGESAGPTVSYLYDRGEWSPVPSLSEDHVQVVALGIGPTGIVVGYVSTEGFSESRPVVWTEGAPNDVTESITGLGDIRLGGLRAVNSNGQILATGSSDAGYHGLVLTPE